MPLSRLDGSAPQSAPTGPGPATVRFDIVTVVELPEISTMAFCGSACVLGESDAGASMVLLSCPAPTMMRLDVRTTCSMYAPAASLMVSPGDESIMAWPIVAQAVDADVQASVSSPKGDT